MPMLGDSIYAVLREETTQSKPPVRGAGWEAAIPKEHRPDLLRHAEGRLQLINDWWTPMPDRAIA